MKEKPFSSTHRTNKGFRQETDPTYISIAKAEMAVDKSIRSNSVVRLKCKIDPK